MIFIPSNEPQVISMKCSINLPQIFKPYQATTFEMKFYVPLYITFLFRNRNSVLFIVWRYKFCRLDLVYSSTGIALTILNIRRNTGNLNKIVSQLLDWILTWFGYQSMHNKTLFKISVLNLNWKTFERFNTLYQIYWP